MNRCAWLATALLTFAMTSAVAFAGDPRFGPADPVVKDTSLLDPKRPIGRELQAHANRSHRRPRRAGATAAFCRSCIDSGAGTAAKTRVLVVSSDEERSWGTVGVSTNIINASWEALVDSVEFYLLKKGARL
jgi:hypothetical protein